MRRKWNGFDILVAVLVVLGLLLLARRALHRTGAGAPTHTVTFTVTSMPSVNAAAIAAQLQPGGQMTVSASGNFVPMGTLTSSEVLPWIVSVPDNGKLVTVPDPLQRLVRMTVVAKAAVSKKTVTINGNPFLVGQQTIFQEGGAQFTGVITGEEVR